MSRRSWPPGRCAISAAPVAADTIGGTIGISHDPDASRKRRSWAVNIRYGMIAAEASPVRVPAVHRTESRTTRRVDADHVAADEQRTGTDGQHRHRWRPVERRHRRVEGVSARGLREQDPVRGGRDEQHCQQRCRCDPGGDRQLMPAGEGHGQQRRCDRHDAGAHDRGEPVRSDVGHCIDGRIEGRKEAA